MSLHNSWQVEQKPGGRGREWAPLGIHPLSWLLSNNRLEKVSFVSVPHTSSNRLLLSNQDKGCSPSVAHSLALPLGPALLNLWIDSNTIAICMFSDCQHYTHLVGILQLSFKNWMSLFQQAFIISLYRSFENKIPSIQTFMPSRCCLSTSGQGGEAHIYKKWLCCIILLHLQLQN